MSRLIRITIVFLLTCAQLRAEEGREEFDFNFDGHPDYRVKTLENGKADQYDVFLFNPGTKGFRKDRVLSGAVNPQPDTEKKQVRCIWPGGHSGAIFSGTVYQWNGKSFDLAYTIRQTHLTIDGKPVYVCVKAKMQDGVPVIESIERIKLHWEN